MKEKSVRRGDTCREMRHLQRYCLTLRAIIARLSRASGKEGEQNRKHPKRSQSEFREALKDVPPVVLSSAVGIVCSSCSRETELFCVYQAIGTRACRKVLVAKAEDHEGAI